MSKMRMLDFRARRGGRKSQRKDASSLRDPDHHIDVTDLIEWSDNVMRFALRS